MPYRLRLFAIGDINAFFGLMQDNMSDLIILAPVSDLPGWSGL